jgi:uncharacterized protein
MSEPNLTDPEDCQGALHPKAIEGLELFNQRKYWLAHEALEAAWRADPGPIRDLYRGILQVAVVYLHISRANYAGAIKVYQRSLKWMQPWPAVCRGIQVARIREDLEYVMEAVLSLGPERLHEFDPALLKPVLYTKEP